MSGPAFCAFGVGDASSFGLIQRPDPPTPVHVAFRADDICVVHAFHAAALEAEATDNGAPGPRPQFHAGYYAAFVLDPDGHNIEAVLHTYAG